MKLMWRCDTNYAKLETNQVSNLEDTLQLEEKPEEISEKD